MAHPLQGYLDEFSYRPGQRVVARMSGSGEARIRLVGLKKTGPDTCESVAIPNANDVTAELRHQELPSGSGFAVRLPFALIGLDDWTLSFWMKPTLVREQGHVVFALRSGKTERALLLSPAKLQWVGEAVKADARLPYPPDRWVQLKISVFPARGELVATYGDVRLVSSIGRPGDDFELVLGRGFSTRDHLGANARIEGPTITRGPDEGISVTAFDFSDNFDAPTLLASAGAPLVGKFINHPTRRVLGRSRSNILDTGDSTGRHNAIHVHEFDLTDALWEETVSLDIPSQLQSGIYAVEAQTGNDLLRLPFVVRAHPGRETAALLLLPTNTYLAYANERLAFSDRGAALTSETEPPLLTGLDRDLEAEPRLSASLYDRHADGSGVHYSSRRRPVLNLSPDYKWWWCTRAPRHFLADLNITQWLDHFSIQYDVATDEDLHREGESLLNRYRVLITGSHPEYTSSRMLSALHSWGTTGNIMYMGANGFYWVTGFDPYDHAVVESRRGFAGTRNWNSDPLELRLSTTGEDGGLWRHRGLAPNALIGVGFSAVGFTKGSGYTRLEASYTPEMSWLFEGIEDKVIGDFGDILGGAAGDELDNADFALGTPADTRVLARSSHDRTFLPSIEQEIEFQHDRGGDRNDRVCAEIVYVRRPEGGQVFGAGSINWCGSLAHNGFDNSASRISLNALRAFLGV
ncbi:N,N-dimethylformamidase beta subunit family domain-containing protein [Mesorhizobium argentiipisi]|uniref:N,N-dimethylformamidase beta subunit-like C-terminal domain-containing protein n=1 Tax=Mesorhizobium argentiipisi TaxID=3015175 RepID=A0ABU8KCI7_9HYPH